MQELYPYVGFNNLKAYPLHSPTYHNPPYEFERRPYRWGR